VERQSVRHVRPAVHDRAERLRGAFVTPGFFKTIGVGAVVARIFVDEDAADIAVISHQLRQRLFGGQANVIGQRIDLAVGRGKHREQRRFTIVGVLPPRVPFSYPEGTDIWLPLTTASLENPRMQDAIMYQVVARLKPGVTLAQAGDDMTAVRAAIGIDLKRDMARYTFWLEPVHAHATGAIRPGLQLLGAIALLVFVVACLNVATLLLARTAERRREIAVQLALGASRGRIIRQLFTESGLMAVIAAAVSVATVAVLQPVLKAAMPASIPRIDEIGVDVFTVAWATALVTLAVVLSTIVPGWRGSAVDPGPGLAQGGRSATASRTTALWRHVLVASQVASSSCCSLAAGSCFTAS
jgi:putative ABC transport system permease protein